jgi:AcrR family transcriptional regulator
MKTEIRQEQIAQAALKLVSRQGLKGFSVAKLALEVGVVPSAIYRHYKNKDQILEAMLELISERLNGNVEAVILETPHALDRLKSLLMRHAQLILHEAPLPRLVFSEEMFNGHRQRRKRIHQIFQHYLGKIEDVIREGQTRGQIRAELSPNTLSVMFLGLVQPAAILWLLSNGEFDPMRHAERAWPCFAEMIHARPVSLK